MNRHAARRSPEPRPSLVIAESIQEAVRLARSLPHSRIVVYERNWWAVDAARDVAESLGFHRQILVHHRDAAKARGPNRNPPATVGAA